MLIWQIFKNHIIENNLVAEGDKIILAVSGGADSIVMADLFCRLKKILDIELIIVNFNHNLRTESKKETKFVERFSKNRRIDFISKSLDTKKFALKNSISVETAGRQLRYLNLCDIAKIKKFNKIATAHNINDHAETILMWLARGTGTDGLTGIPVFRKLDKNLSLIRPLLAVSRDMIEQYAKKQKLKFCTDKSNFSQDYTRNKIRLNILPELKKINPLAVEHFFELSKIIARENAYFDKKTEGFILKNVKKSKNSTAVYLKPFLNYDNAIKYRILKNIIPVKKDYLHINAILKWLVSSKKSNYVLNKFWSVKKTGNKLLFVKQ